MEEQNGYIPPASLNLNDFQYAIDDAIVQAIVKIGIKVNREELLKALKYDRGQYKAGYDAGFADGFLKTLHLDEISAADDKLMRHARWEPGNSICPVCGKDKFKDLDADIWSDWTPPYCPNCGTRMDLEGETNDD